MLLIRAIGFSVPKIGTYWSIKILILGPIIPERKDRSRVTNKPITVFTLLLFLLEEPMNMPRATPNRLPNIRSKAV